MKKIRFVNNWKSFPKGAGFDFGLLRVWRCRYQGGGGSWGVAIFNLGFEVWKNPASPNGQYAGNGKAKMNSRAL